MYLHERRQVRCLVHGDDFVFTGLRSHLEWVHRELAKTVLLKRVGILGPDSSAGETQEIRVLNRVLRLCPEGIRYEADPRHAEILASMVATSAKPLTTPGVKASSTTPSVHSCRNPSRIEGDVPEGKVCLLDGAATADEAGWGAEEEEQDGEESAQEETSAARRRRPGRQERGRAETPDSGGEREDLDPDEDGDALLDPAEVTLFRATTARANYLALDRPEVAFASKELCRRMSTPRVRDRRALTRLCRYLLGAPRAVYEFCWQEPTEALRVFCDTDFAGCPLTRRSTSGGCALRGKHLLKHWSSTQKAITLSSGEAELGGVVKGAAEAMGLQSLATDLGLEVSIELHADSAAAIGICRRAGIGKVRHLAVGQLWIQERLREGALRLFKVHGPANPADLYTKHLPAAGIDAHLQTVGVRLESGRAASAPQVSAEIQAWL